MRRTTSQRPVAQPASPDMSAMFRATLAYLVRRWRGFSAKELGGNVYRDPSMISRPYGQYAMKRDLKAEETAVSNKISPDSCLTPF
jgi:hypothetical protein